ncbi:MAG: hypothetical protein ABSB19_17295 [Methylomonas sp.]|jgi:hypothetical protein
MKMKPSFEADKFCKPQGSVNAKKLGYLKASAGFHVVQPSLRPFTMEKVVNAKHLGTSSYFRLIDLSL